MRFFLVPLVFSAIALTSMMIPPNIPCAEVDRSILPATSKFGYFGYIRAETGESILPACFLEAGFFADGLAIVEVDEDTPPFLPGYAIIDSEGNALLHGAALIESAYAGDKVGGYPFLVEGDGALGRIFVVYGKEGPGRYGKSYGEIGVYHADKGWLLPKSKMGRLKFINSVTFIYEGDLFIDGKKFPMPRGFMIDHVDFEDGYVRIRERGEKKLSPPKYGVLRLDGSVWVPAKYHDLTRAGDTGFWIASRYSEKTLSVMKQLLRGKDADLDKKKDYIDSDVFDASGKKLRSFSSHDLPYFNGTDYEYNKKGKRHVERLGDGAPVAQPAPKPVSGYFIFTEGKYQGIKDAEGKTLLAPIFNEIKNLGQGHFAASGRKDTREWKWGLISLIPGETETFHTIMPFIYSDIQATRYRVPNSPLVIKEEAEKGNFYGKYGLAGRDGTILQPPKYYNTFYFNDAGLAVVYEFGSGSGVIDMKGEEVLPANYKTIFDQMRMEGMKEPVFILANQEGKWGIANGKGDILLPFEYGHISKAGQWFRVEDLKRDRVGAYNYKTRVLIPTRYSSLEFDTEGIIAYTRIDGEDHFEFLDVKGKKIKNLPNYSRMDASRHSPRVYEVKKDGLIGLIDARGKEIFPCKFVHFYEAGPVYFRAKDQDGMIFYVDRSGKEYRPK